MSSAAIPAGAEPLTPATWRDGKRYAWLLGLLVPTLPFLAWGLVEATGLGVFWFFGPMLVFGIFPLLEKVSDEPTADLLTQRMQIHEKTAWMLRSLLAA